jgi:hypothetical protein
MKKIKKKGVYFLMADISFFYGPDSKFNSIEDKKENAIYFSNVLGTINDSQVNVKSYLYFCDDSKNMVNIVPRLLDVENGGTGRNSLNLG